MKVYFISGLAADRRVFKNIRLPEGFEAVYLDWIPPGKRESLASYSARLAQKIAPGEKYALLGLSMGGMIASEIAHQQHEHGRAEPAITILISSMAGHQHLPTHYKIAKWLKLYKLIPASLLKSASTIKHLFTPETAEDRMVLAQVIKESDPSFIRWAVPAILKWKNVKVPRPLLHIHGSKDMTLPLRYVQPTHIIPGGGHVMILNRAEELNKLIEDALLSIDTAS